MKISAPRKFARKTSYSEPLNHLSIEDFLSQNLTIAKKNLLYINFFKITSNELENIQRLSADIEEIANRYLDISDIIASRIAKIKQIEDATVISVAPPSQNEDDSLSDASFNSNH